MADDADEADVGFLQRAADELELRLLVLREGREVEGEGDLDIHLLVLGQADVGRFRGVDSVLEVRR